MRLWLGFIVLGVLLWAASLPGTDPAIRTGIGAAALAWCVVRATQSQRS